MALSKITSPSITDTAIHGRRNLIINGAMQVAQRGTSSTSTTGISYHTVDRFNFRGQSTGVFTIAQDTDSPVDFYYSTKITVTTPDTSIGGGERYWVTSYLEGNTLSHLNFGTSSAKTVTLSFYVKSSLTGTFSGGLVNSSFDRAQAFTYTISSANTWERKTVTISGDTSGTWLVTTGIGLSVSFDLGAATNRQQSAGAWTASGSVAATGASQVIATNGATWQITGVQLEVGSQATPFEHRSFGEELKLCNRYYQEFNYDRHGYYVTNGGASSASQSKYLYTYYGGEMRATASISTPSVSNGYRFLGSGNDHSHSTIPNIDNPSRLSVQFGNNQNTITAGNSFRLLLNASGAKIKFDAEL